MPEATTTTEPWQQTRAEYLAGFEFVRSPYGSYPWCAVRSGDTAPVWFYKPLSAELVERGVRGDSLARFAKTKREVRAGLVELHRLAVLNAVREGRAVPVVVRAEAEGVFANAPFEDDGYAAHTAVP